MIEEYEKRKRKQISSMRSLMDYAMGILIFLFGAFLLFRDQFDLDINRRFKPDDMDKIFGGDVPGVWCMADIQGR
jgi:hypothetical protein